MSDIEQTLSPIQQTVEEMNDFTQSSGKDNTKTEPIEKKEFPFSFKGTARQYFKIWIVNIALTILTLGIYSAWAKVRTKKYFYGNTILDGSSFEYTANPIGIFKGRIIVVLIFTAYFAVSKYYPQFFILMLIPFYAIFPFFVQKSLSFNARYSAYRNINFKFSGPLSGAYQNYLLMYFLMPLTLGFILPSIIHGQKEYHISNSSYGTTKMNFSKDTGPFVSAYLPIMLFGIAVFLFTFCSSVTQVLIKSPKGFIASSFSEDIMIYAIIVVIYIIMTVVYLIFFARIKSGVFNAVFDGTTIDNIHFVSTQETMELYKIYMTNIIAIIFSLGLLIPWAKIRLAKYRVENLTLFSPTELDTFAAGEKEQISAIGDEMGEFFDFEIGF